MDFGHYSAEAAQIGVDLVNSFNPIGGTEELPDVVALEEFLSLRELKVPERLSERDLDDVRRVRGRLRDAFEAEDEAATVKILNELLAESKALPHISNHDDEPWHIHYTAPDAPPAQRLMAVAAMGLAEVLVHFGRERFGMCSADDCIDVFVDTSRNRSRLYCGQGCSTRTNVAKFRARHKEQL